MPRPAPVISLLRFLVRAPRVWILVILALAFAVRVGALTSRPLWFDEGYSIYFAGVAPLETARLTALDIHPPLSYWALQLWTLLVGWNEPSVRFFSLSVGLLTVALLARLGSRTFGWPVGLLAAGALALSPLHRLHSLEVRMYGLLALLVLLATWCWWLVPRRLARLGYLAAMGAALLTQYYAVLALAAQLVLLPWLNARRQRLLLLLLALLPLALWGGYATPTLVGYVRQKVVTEGYTPLGPLAFVGELAAGAFGGGLTGGGAAVVAGALALLGLVGAGQLGRVLATLVVVSLAGGYVLNLVSPFHPPGWERLFLFVLPPWLLLAARGAWVLSQRPERLVRPLAMVAVAGVLLASLAGLLASPPPVDDPRPLVRAIERLAEPTDLVLAVYPWQVGYLRLYDRRPLPEIRLVPAEAWAADPLRLERELAAWTAGRRVWFLAYQRLGRQLEERIERAFGEQLFLIAADWYGDHRLLFARAGEASERRAAEVRFGELRLREARLDQTPIPSGSGALPVEFRWEGTAREATLHLRLADERGVTWAQHDSPLVLSGESGQLRRAVLAPPATPPGRYRLLLSVREGEALQPAVAADAVPVPELDLGPVEVTLPRGPVPPEAVAVGRPQGAAFGGARLLGSDFSSGPYRPGETVLVALSWVPGPEPPEVVVQLGEETSRGRAGAPPPGWPAAQPIREVRLLTARGSGRLAVILSDGQSRLTLGEVEVVPRPLPPPPPVMLPVDARFGEAVTLLGATVFSSEGTVLPSGILARDMEVTLVWRADAQVPLDLAVFVHLIGPDERPLAQHDGRPANGEAPTRGWRPGEVIVDRHRLRVPASVPPGQYQLVAGLYQPPAGPRLPTASGDRVLLTTGVLP
jgi:4-amino-4-deoxy-L-arabinose transferase-like glycosyltransferase